MNILLTSIFFISFSLLPALASAATNTYYVTQNGKGSRTGKNLENAWAVSDFNNSSNWNMSENINKIDPGDTVYFYGAISTRITVTNGGTSGDPITLDGYEGGDCHPLNSVCSSSALLLEGLDIGGNAYGPDYIIIQDFRMTCSSASFCFGVYPDVSESDGSGWSESITVRRNYIYETYGMMAIFYRTKYLTVENNKFVHFGQGMDVNGGISFNCAEDLVIQNNEFGHDDKNYPSSTTSANTCHAHGIQRALVQYNDIYGGPTGTCLSFKEDGFPPYSGDTDDIIIRFNKIHDCEGGDQAQAGKGISLVMRESQSLDDAYIYANFVYNTDSSSIRSVTKTSNVHIWSNVLVDADDHGILIGPRANGDTPPDGVWIYNNVIARANKNGDTNNSRGGIAITGGTNIFIKNNILWNNRPTGSGSKYNQIYSSTTLSSLEHNTLYHSLSKANYYYDGAFRTLAAMLRNYNFEKDPPAGVIEDPGFKDPDGEDNIYGTADDDYTLNGTHLNNGADLSQCFDVSIQGKNYHVCYDDALDPNTTNWKTTPPTVRTTKQEDHGTWERGAYVYTSEVSSPATVSKPKNLRTRTP